MAKQYSLIALSVKGYDVSLMALAENKVPSGYNEGPIGLLTWSEILSLIENYCRLLKENDTLGEKRTTLPLLREILYYRREEISKDRGAMSLLGGMYKRGMEQARFFTDYVEECNQIQQKSIQDICMGERTVDLFYQETESISRCLHRGVRHASMIV